ncbi:MAG: ankyrin repeat domain-containing protein [Gallionella sp.]
MSAELLAAVKSGDVDNATGLMDKGADCNGRDEDGATLLMLASYSGNLPLVMVLLKAGAEINASDERGWTALMKAAHNADKNAGFPDVVQALIAAGANIEAPISYGVRPLMLAAGYGETAVVECLLQAGADVSARNEGGYTALMMVKQKHYVDVINLLHEAEQLAGIGEGSCTSKHEPGSNVVTFLKPVDKT